MDWIDVKDRLPNKGDIVLVTETVPQVTGGVIRLIHMMGFKRRGHWWYTNDGWRTNHPEWVTHWMPLPKPATGGE